MFFRTLTLFIALAFASPVQAYNDEFHEHGQAFLQSWSMETTANSLRAMADVAEESGKEEGRFLAYQLRVEAKSSGTGNALFNVLLPALKDPEALATPEGYSYAMGPILSELALAFEHGTIDVATTIDLGDQLLELDELAQSAGLPGMRAILESQLGEFDGQKAMGLLEALLGIGEQARDGASIEALSESAMRAQQDLLLSVVPLSLKPYAPIVPLFTAELRWSGEMFSKTDQAMQLVTEAIRSGKFDEEAYSKLENDIIELSSRGPWDSEFFTDALTGWCYAMPELGPYCAELYRTIKNLMNGSVCGQIDCDCANVENWFGKYRPECEKHELDAKLQCAIDEKVVVGCRLPYGPGATPIAD